MENRRPTAGTQNDLNHHDNTRPHKASAVIQYLEEQHVQILSHSLYSPDLAGCDFGRSLFWRTEWLQWCCHTFRTSAKLLIHSWEAFPRMTTTDPSLIDWDGSCCAYTLKECPSFIIVWYTLFCVISLWSLFFEHPSCPVRPSMEILLPYKEHVFDGLQVRSVEPVLPPTC